MLYYLVILRFKKIIVKEHFPKCNSFTFAFSLSSLPSPSLLLTIWLYLQRVFVKYVCNVFKVALGPEFWYSIFLHFRSSLWFLVTTPNFHSLRRLEVAFFGRFLSRFFGRHYWPLFQKLACELAEVTLKAYLKPSTFTWLLAARNLTVVEGRFPANCLLHGLGIFVATAVMTGITCGVVSWDVTWWGAV